QDDTKIQGKIKSITADKNEFVLTGKEDSKDYTIVLDLKSQVQLNKRAGKLEDLKTGDQVTVHFRKENGKMMASKILCTRKSSFRHQGKTRHVSLTGRAGAQAAWLAPGSLNQHAKERCAMYSMVLMMALSGGGEVPNFGCGCRGCSCSG